MLGAIAKSFSGLIRRPLLFLPAILFVLVDYFLLSSQRSGFMASITTGALNGQGILQSLVSAFYADQIGFGIMLAGLAVLFFLEIFVMFAYSRAAYDLDKNVSSFLAFSETIGRFLEAAKFWLFGLFAAVLFLAAIAFSLWVYEYVAYLGIILAIISIIAAIGAFIGLFMTIPAMATRQLELKRSLKDSWAFAQKYLLGIILLLIILIVINEMLLAFAQNWIIAQVPEYEAIVSGAIDAIKISYSGMAVALFYIQRQKKKK